MRILNVLMCEIRKIHSSEAALCLPHLAKIDKSITLVAKIVSLLSYLSLRRVLMPNNTQRIKTHTETSTHIVLIIMPSRTSFENQPKYMLDSNQLLRLVINVYGLQFIVLFCGWVRNYFTVFHGYFKCAMSLIRFPQRQWNDTGYT